MKKVYGLLAALIIVATVSAQATTQEKREIKNDLVKERVKRHEAAHDVLRGEPERAREDHREAVAYHKDAVRGVQQEHRRHMQTRHHVGVRRHYRHYHRPYHRPYHRTHRTHTTVIIRH